MLGDHPPTLIYPSRGVASLFWDERGRDATLANLIGRTRSEILEAVGEPLHTTGLARMLGRSPGTSRSTCRCCSSWGWSHALAWAEKCSTRAPPRRHAPPRSAREHSRRVGETSWPTGALAVGRDVLR